MKMKSKGMGSMKGCSDKSEKKEERKEMGAMRKMIQSAAKRKR